MAITIKKSSIAAMKDSQAEGQNMAAADAGGAGSPEGEAQAAAVSAVPQRRGSSYTVFAILALVATVLCIALLAFQWLEWSYYYQPPSAFPIVNR